MLRVYMQFGFVYL